MEEVVKVCDPIVWPLPVFPTLCAIWTFVVSAAWDWILHHLSYEKKSLKIVKRRRMIATCAIIEAGFMEDTRKQLETNDCINKYHKEDQECNVEERDHCHYNTVEHNL